MGPKIRAGTMGESCRGRDQSSTGPSDSRQSQPERGCAVHGEVGAENLGSSDHHSLISASALSMPGGRSLGKDGQGGSAE